MWRIGVVAALLLALPASAGAKNGGCKTVEVKVKAYHWVHVPRARMVRGRLTIVYVPKYVAYTAVEQQAQCIVVLTAPKTTTPRQTVTSASTAATPTLGAAISPTFTQSPANPLVVTYSYSASATLGGSPETSLPVGTLSLSSDGSVACSISVGGSVTGGHCSVTYGSYGNHTVSATYVSGSASFTVGPQTAVVEPPPATVSDAWGTAGGTAPSISAILGSTSAAVTVSDASFEGATSIGLKDNLGDTCTATVSGTAAACSMAVSGRPTAFTITYPGGSASQATEPLAPGGTQLVTTDWPAEVVAVDNPSVTGSVTVSWTSGVIYPGRPLTISRGQTLLFGATAVGSLSMSDPYPLGGIEFTVSPSGPTLSDVQPSASPQCSDSHSYVGQASGDCEITFPSAGTFTVSTEYVTNDANYDDAAGPSVTVEVS